MTQSEISINLKKIRGGFSLRCKGLRLKTTHGNYGGSNYTLTHKGIKYYDYRSDMTIRAITSVVNDFFLMK